MTIIRPAQLHDLPQLTSIYNYYIEHTVATFDTEPVTVEQRRAWFDQYAETGPYRLCVAEVNGEIVGYATSSPYRPRPAFRDSIEVSIYLMPTMTGQGIGTRLFTALFDALAGEQLHRAYGAIVLPNPAVVALNRRFGFVEIGVFNEYGIKGGRYWSSLWMEKRLDSSAAARPGPGGGAATMKHC